MNIRKVEFLSMTLDKPGGELAEGDQLLIVTNGAINVWIGDADSFPLELDNRRAYGCYRSPDFCRIEAGKKFAFAGAEPYSVVFHVKD
jgi:hypothetical protein